MIHMIVYLYMANILIQLYCVWKFLIIYFLIIRNLFFFYIKVKSCNYKCTCMYSLFGDSENRENNFLKNQWVIKFIF
jgi:hypothetical protein